MSFLTLIPALVSSATRKNNALFPPLAKITPALLTSLYGPLLTFFCAGGWLDGLVGWSWLCSWVSGCCLDGGDWTAGCWWCCVGFDRPRFWKITEGVGVAVGYVAGAWAAGCWWCCVGCPSTLRTRS